jgi:hypothetical protein
MTQGTISVIVSGREHPECRQRAPPVQGLRKSAITVDKPLPLRDNVIAGEVILDLDRQNKTPSIVIHSAFKNAPHVEALRPGGAFFVLSDFLCVCRTLP